MRKSPPLYRLVDERSAKLVFRQKVIGLLAAEGLLEEGRIELLDSWKSGSGRSGARAAAHAQEILEE